MSEHARIGKRLGHAVEVDLAHWIDVDHDALPEKRRAQFLTRRKAIEMYLAGASEAELQETMAEVNKADASSGTTKLGALLREQMGKGE